MPNIIVDWDLDADNNFYVGDGTDGCYYQTAEDVTGGWYVTVMINSDEDLITDDGPYSSEEEARTAGNAKAVEWCLENGVQMQVEDPMAMLSADETPLNEYSMEQFLLESEGTE